ncbi:MAG: ABC-F family ATP-binding cassette domain-containing protein, partial [Oscillospiraceae bacterium]|nr:ABC-F family ATP-binding cassette domain-containing protein [Oscillospiraceae bacterium]
MAEISVQELHKYFGEHHVLKGLSFDLQAGERASIVGPNGCGKSTLLKILAGLQEYDGGVVAINKGARLGLLEQLPVYDPDTTVKEVLWQSAEQWRSQVKGTNVIAGLKGSAAFFALHGMCVLRENPILGTFDVDRPQVRSSSLLSTLSVLKSRFFVLS